MRAGAVDEERHRDAGGPVDDAQLAEAEGGREGLDATREGGYGRVAAEAHARDPARAQPPRTLRREGGLRDVARGARGDRREAAHAPRSPATTRTTARIAGSLWLSLDDREGSLDVLTATGRERIHGTARDARLITPVRGGRGEGAVGRGQRVAACGLEGERLGDERARPDVALGLHEPASRHEGGHEFRAELLRDRRIGRVERAGYTLVPLDLHFKRGMIKLEVGLAKGKKQHDKRATIREREWGAMAAPAKAHHRLLNR